MTLEERKALRAKLKAEKRELRAKADGILADTTRAYDEKTRAEVDDLMKRIDQIEDRMDALEENAAPGDEDNADEEDGAGEPRDNTEEDDGVRTRTTRADHAHPNVIRSRGRRSEAGNIIEHARDHRYSLSRAAGRVLDNRSLDGIEAEVDSQLRAQRGGCAGDFAMPFGNRAKLNKNEREMALASQRRDLTLTTGAGAVPTYWEAEEFIDFLYPVMVGPKLGFRYMDGLLATTKLPRQNAVPTVSAVAEEGSASGSSPGLDNVTLTPHTITANVTVSRKFLMQSVIQADRYVMNTGAKQMGVVMDQYALTGTGSSNQPTGLFNNSAVTNYSIAASNTLAYTNVTALERLVAEANAMFGNLGYLTSPYGWQVASQTPKVTGSTPYPIFILSEQGEINGFPTVRSAQIPHNFNLTVGSSTYTNCTALAFGNWDMLALATFGDGLDVIVDPYTGSTAGSVTITFLLDMDTNVLQGGAFAICPNIS